MRGFQVHRGVLRLRSALALPCALVPLAAHGQAARPTRHVDATLSTTLQYDSNGLLSDSAVNGSGPSQSDLRATPSLNLDIYVPVGRQAVFLAGGIGYDFHTRYKRFNSERINLAGGADLSYAGNCTSHVELGYARYHTNLADIVDIGGGFTDNNREERRSFGIDAGCGGAIGLRPSIGFRREEVRNSSFFRRISNDNTDTYTTQLGYSRPALGTVSIYGSFSDGEYPNRRTATFVDGVRIFSGGLQYERAVGTRLTARGSLGYSRVEPKAPGVPKYGGLSYSLSATYRGDRISLTALGSRSVEQSNILDISYDIDTNFSLNAEYALSPKVNLLGDARYQRRSFRSSPLIPSSLARGSDRLYDVGGGVRLFPRNRLSFTLEAEREHRDADVRLLNYNDTRVSLTATVRL
ncbi:MAG: outer membrane beta-barrel protein [Sphingomonadaceae bacterium]|nr:outer membrane beta-barrel protein [Sphingomonadaceae bacterium]